MTKIIVIDSNRYALPEGMSAKDIQAVAGFLVTLTRIDYEYCYGSGEQAYYLAAGAQVGLGELELVTKDEARQRSENPGVD